MWFTDTQISGIPAFAGLSPSQIAQVAGDVGVLYTQIGVSPGISDDQLRAWGEQSGITPERYNVAAAALSQAGKAVDIPTGPIPPTGPDVPSAAGSASLGAVISGEPLVRAAAFSQSELRAAVDRAKLDVPKSATKADLAAALAAAPSS